MDRFVILLEGEFCRNLLLALAHTLWQGALAAGVLFFYLRRTPATAANQRYLASVAALGAVVLGALLTWSVLSYKPVEATRDAGLIAAIEAGDNTNHPAAAKPPTSYDQNSAAKAEESSRTSGPRQAWIMEAWLAGVALMFLRLVALVVGGSRLRRQCRLIEDSQALNLVEQLRNRMSISRRIRVLVGDSIATPGVVGCFWPTLLLPASMVSGIPAEDLQAILSHELAHVRRYDYLVNFLQMVVEALLFFNPAVWWISRQVRIEREACCDAAGVLWTGQRTKYAEVLVAWAQRRGTPAPAVGFGQDLGGGNILDRVRRILVAGHQPRPHVPWHIATAMIVLSLACLVALQQATGLAVNLAGRILTPQERIDEIAGISAEYGYGGRQDSPEDQIEVSGVVRTWDGAPLPAHPTIFVRRVGLGFGDHSIFLPVSSEGLFHTLAPRGRIYLMAAAAGYAPACAGPFEARRGGALQGIQLVLEKGFPGRIQIADENGRPVPGAELVGGYTYPDSGSYNSTIKLTSDANGIAIVDHAAAQKIALQITARGFEFTRVEGLLPDPNQICVVTLKRARPTGGVVVAQATGRPLAGADVRVLVLSQGSRSQIMGHQRKTPDAVTDADGRFQLDGVRSGWRYLLFVQAPGYGYQYVSDVVAGDQSLHIALGEKKTIRGKIIGDLSLLSTGADATPTLSVQSSYQYPGYAGEMSAPTKSPVTIRDGVGYFEIEDFWGQVVTLAAGARQVRLNIEKDRLDDVVIDLRPSARRQVVLRFQTPPDAPPVEGCVRIDSSTEDPRLQPHRMTPDWLPIRDNQARCEVAVPSTFKYGIDFSQGKRPVGYWFNETVPTIIPAGEGPFVINVPVFPAGAIYGKILRPDGSAAETARATLVFVKKPDVENGQAISLSSLYHVLERGVDRGTFNATPLPLGGVYAVVAYENYAFVMSDSFVLDEKNPIINVDLPLPQGVDVAGRLLSADGTPARNDVALHVSLKRGEQSWGQVCGHIQPDEAGRFVFKNVGVGPAGACSVRVIGGAGYRPTTYGIKDLRAPVVIRLEKGLRLTGTVIDDGTGWPVPGVEVYAFAVDGPDGRISRSWEMLEAEGRTDKQGRFTFTNMAAGQYSLNVRDVNWTDQRRPVATGGQNDPVVLHIRIPDGSDLKPQTPQ